MKWTTVIWLMVTGVCIGMAIVYLMFWFRPRQAWSSPFFFEAFGEVRFERR